MNDTRKASLADIRRMHAHGSLHHDPSAPEDLEDLGPEFWTAATLTSPQRSRSVHLKVEADVFEFFKQGGKGHLTRMQNVLRAYVQAHRRS